jgi:hypothetical protein
VRFFLREIIHCSHRHIAQVHRLPGMVNVVNKMCEVPNCFKRPSLNYPGVRPAVRCGEHKLEGMTNAFRKSSTPRSVNACLATADPSRVKVEGDTTDSGSDDETCPGTPDATATSTASDNVASSECAAASAAVPSAPCATATGVCLDVWSRLVVNPSTLQVLRNARACAQAIRCSGWHQLPFA